jgi:hypothetical protein
LAFAERNHFLSSVDVLKRFALTEAEQKALHGGELVVRREAIDLKGLKAFDGETLAKRPANAPLPWRIESYGRYNFLFLLDFGSFRDIQRHRNGVCQIPLLDGRYGLHPWYLANFKALLPAADCETLMNDIKAQFDCIAALGKEGVAVSTALSQYLYPMGTMGLVQVSYSVPETVYVGELRSGKTVHPSLRPVAQKMLRVLAEDLPGIALHGDMDEDSWTAKRGEQTIAAKG